MHDHFRVLGLELDASHDNVKKAFRTLAKQWHPDKNRSPGAEDRFKEIKAAYDFLQSADRRDVHAADLRRHRARETTEQHQHEGRHEHHAHHHHHDRHHHQGHGHGHHQHQERQQQSDAAHNAAGRSTTAPPPQQKQQPQQQHHHDQHQDPLHKHQHRHHHHHHHHHHTQHDAHENSGSRDGDWHTGGGAAGKKRGHYRFDRASRSPNAFERDGGGFGQRRAKTDNASSFPNRTRHASPTFEFTFDFMSFDPLIEDILNLRKMFDFAATAAAAAAAAAPTSPRPGSAQKKAKKKVDPFGNPLPDSVDPGIYDWSAPRAFSQNWADLGDPEFFCHYCGRVMAITLLRRHEPKCAKLGGARRTEFLDPQNFSDHESVIYRTRQKLAQRAQQQQQQQQQQQHGKAGEKFVECEQCGISLDEQAAQTHRAQCKHQPHPHPSPRPPPSSSPPQQRQQQATSTSEERRGRSGSGEGPSGGGWNSQRHHVHRRSASAHPHSRPPWNNNFSEDKDKVPDTSRSTGRSEDSGHEKNDREPHHHQHSHHHHHSHQQPSKKSETPISSKGCDKCVARFGRHAGFFCSCSVSHLL